MGFTKRHAALGLLGAVAGTAAAQPGGMPGSAVAVTAQVYVERDAGEVRALEPARRLARGDRVVTLLSWSRPARSGGFTLVNPLPHGLAWQGSADPAAVSVDGGRSWGRLGSLRIGDRLASPEDVTHVRWRVSSAAAAAGSGRIAYSGLVR